MNRDVRRKEMMYSIDKYSKDAVRELKDIPQSSVGAPCPMIVADEFKVFVGFYLQDTPTGWNGTTVRVIDPSSADMPIGIVIFKDFVAYCHGMPNDEAFSGHPLYTKGLRPYGAFEVEQSSWIAQLREMNRVHYAHKDAHYAKYRHFVLAFHDTTFEAVAESYEVQTLRGVLTAVMAQTVNEWK